MPEWIKNIQKWFPYRHRNVKYRIYLDEDTYIASASNGDLTVYHYGITPEKAKEFARFKLDKAQNEKKRTWYYIKKGNVYYLYR